VHNRYLCDLCDRELDCFSEVGLMEGGQYLDIPPRALAAVPKPNSVAALLFVSRAIYRRALDMVQEYTIGRAVDRCCRLPFVRHTPLKVSGLTVYCGGTGLGDRTILAHNA